MKPHLETVLLLVASLLACGEQASSPVPVAERPSPSPSAASLPDAGPTAATTPTTIDLEGTVVDEVGIAVYGRPVTVMDARGQRVSLLTDDGGTFHVAGVTPPYDVSITGSPSAKVPVTTAWLGLLRRDPRFDVIDRDARPTEPAATTVRVELAVPPCFVNRCWALVSTASPSGRGQAASSYGAGETSCRFAVEHSFHLATPDSIERLAIHALAGDESFSSYAFADVVSTAVPGTMVDLGTLPLAPVTTKEPLTVSVTGPSIPADWHWTVATELAFSDGATMTLQYVDGPALVTRLPALSGASVAVGAWAQSPPDDATLAQAVSFAWSGRLSLSTHAVVLDLAPPANLVSPSQSGTLSRRGDGFVWAARKGTSSLVVSDLARGKPWIRLHASGDAVSFARLARIGIAPPELGEYLVELTEQEGLSIDELASASAPFSALEVDSPLAGTSAHEQFTFTVTP